ncbi:MAG: murein biosynthesis integral membrane protein MurJ [Anaerolineales bacterium]|nr:murein biosynthesis integral membrane protein MurJ [Anaerolineales bacterium]
MSQAKEDTTPANNRAQVVQAAGIVAAAFVVSRILGFGRDYVIGVLYGAQTIEVNAYSIANLFPETIFFVIAGGAMTSAYLPTFTAYFARNDEKGAWRLFSAITNLLVLAVTAISIVTALIAPWLVELLYPELVAGQPELLALTVALMRVMLLSTIIFGASGVVMATLNARQHFLMPALAPIIYNLGIILGGLLFAPNVMGLAIGAVVGALGHLLIQLPMLRRVGGQYRPVLSLRLPGVRQVLWLMGPRVLGLSFSRLNQVAMSFLAGALMLGSIRALELGWRLMFMPISIIGQAIGIAAFPTFAALAAQNAYQEMRRILVDTLRLIFFLGLPITVVFGLLGRPLVTLLLAYGVFRDEPDSIRLVAVALALYGLALVALSSIEILSRAFYSLEDTWTPVIAGALQIGLMVVLGLWLSRGIFAARGWLPLGGVALGASIANWLEASVLLWLLRRKLHGLDGRHLADGLSRMLGATVAMALVVAGLNWFLADWHPLLAFGLAAAGGGLVYLIAAYLLGVAELTQISHLLLRRLRRK